MKKAILGLGILLACVSFADQLEDATDLYLNRGDVLFEANPQQAAVQLADEIISLASASSSYEAKILVAKAAYFKGSALTEKSAKLAAFEQGIVSARNAIALGKKSGDPADGYFYAGTNLGRWAQTNGVMASLARKDELAQYMKDSMSRLAQSGMPGASLEGYGPHRLLGRMYFKLPSFAGGNIELSLQHLEIAYQKGYVDALEGEKFALGAVFYAESLIKAGRKDQARAILDDILQYDETNVDELNEVCEFEAVYEDLPLAKQLRSTL